MKMSSKYKFGEKVRDSVYEDIIFILFYFCVGYNSQHSTKGVNKILQYYTAIVMVINFII